MHILCRSFDRPAYGFHHMNLALLESNASLLLCKVYSLYLLINERTMKISSLSQRTLHVQSPLQINVEIHHLLLIHNCGCHWTSKSRWLKQLQHTLSQSLLKSTTLYPICLMFVIGSVVLRPRSLFQFSFMQFFIWKISAWKYKVLKKSIRRKTFKKTRQRANRAKRVLIRDNG